MSVLQTIEPFALVALQAAATQADDKIESVFATAGDHINDLVEGTETQFDDFAKARLVMGLKAMIAQLEVDAVDGPVGDDSDDDDDLEGVVE